MDEITVLEDNFDGNGPLEHEYVSQSPNVLINSIENLDGSQKTCVCYYYTDQTYLTVAGGNDGRFVCYLTAGEKMKNLINKDNSGLEQVEIIAAGQLGLFNNRLCLDLEKTKQAAMYFFEHHTTNPNLDWEDQD